MAKKFGISDPQYLQDGIDALAYLILHIAKVKASEAEFETLYSSVGLNPKPQFRQAAFDVIYPYIEQIRDLLEKDNNKSTVNFQDLDWRLSMIVASRARHNVMVPKYTLKMEFLRGDENHETVLCDSDYNNMKRLQQELETALKSIDGKYSKKVLKFIK